MMTVVACGWILRACSSTWSPSIPGIFMSTRRMAQGSWCSFSIADGPSAAEATVYPSFSSHPVSDSRTISSSSTMRILVLAVDMGSILLKRDIPGPASRAETRALCVDGADAGRARHHARRRAAVFVFERVAVHQSERVSQLVYRLARQPRRGQPPIGRGGEPGRRNHRGHPLELCLAEDEGQHRDEQVDVEAQ